MGHSPLAAAARDGDVTLVQTLIAKGGRLDGRDGALYTGSMPGCLTGAAYHVPLSEAAKKGHIEIMAVLLDAGADINEADYRGETALIHACLEDRLGSVEALLGRGADVERIGSSGNALASLKPGWSDQLLAIARLLLEQGCSPHAGADYCESAIDKWTVLAGENIDPKVAPALLPLLELFLPHADDRAGDVKKAIKGLQKLVGKKR